MLKYRIYNCHCAVTHGGIDEMTAHVMRCVDDAVMLGMNIFVMAKDWPVQTADVVRFKYFPPLTEYADESLTKRYATAYARLAAYAKRAGLEFFISTTEFNVPKQAYIKYPDWAGARRELGWELLPGANPCFTHPYTREHFAAKIRELCEIAPDAAGFELWLGEKLDSPLYCACEKCRALPAGERLLQVILWLRDALKIYGPGKKIIARSYLCAGRCFREPEVFGPVLDKLPSDIIFALKGQYGDFMYLNDPHPLAGKLLCETVIEFDLGGEKRGFHYGYFSGITGYLQMRMRRYLKAGAKGFMFRHIDWLGDVNRAQAFAAAKLCAEPKTRGENHEANYLASRFGKDAAAALCGLMRTGAQICETDLHIIGCGAFSCLGTFPESMTRFKYNVFDHSARMKKGALERLMKNAGDPSEALAEKDLARSLALKFEAELEKARNLLPEKTYGGLKLSAEAMKLLCEPHRLLTELFFAFLRYERSVYSDGRLSAAHSLADIIRRAREWSKRRGEALGQIDLPLLRKLQGIDFAVRAQLDAENPRIEYEQVTALCERVENALDKNWEYFNWNIVI
ncbi:MAG: hypothetical protein FWF03_00590 [Defluviitaleaceae bacterium]|nr:hypothetical protein [Defluviitaleaceae bacterium]